MTKSDEERWTGFRAKWATLRYQFWFRSLLPILLLLVSLLFGLVYLIADSAKTQQETLLQRDLAVAQRALNQFGERQQQLMLAIREQLLSQVNNPADDWLVALNRLEHNFDFDFLHFWPHNKRHAQLELLVDGDHLAVKSGYQKLSPFQLRRLGVKREHSEFADVNLQPVPNGVNTSNDLSALVYRTFLPVTSQRGELLGWLDGGQLLDQSSTLVSSMRDLLFSVETEASEGAGTVAVYVDGVQVSAAVTGRFKSEQVPLANELRRQLGKPGLPQMTIHRSSGSWSGDIFAPIIGIQGESVGVLRVGVAQRPMSDSGFNFATIITLILLAVTASICVLWRGTKSLLRPLEHIHDVMRALHAGESRRIGSLGLSPNSQLAQLAYQIDTMLDQLQDRNLQVQIAANELDQLVTERTYHLEKRTQQLKENIRLLEQTRQRVVISEKMASIGVLTAGIAHEINNPTSVILGNVELIKAALQERSVDLDEEIDLIIQQVDRINSIIQSLLHYARPGEVVMTLERMSVNAVVEEVIPLVRLSLRRKGVELTVALQATETVEVNRQQLLQVLINLVINGANACQSGEGKVHILTENRYQDGTPTGVLLSVSDNGVGISPELQTRIFDPFFTTSKSGTGLGLSLSYGIVKQFGGEFNVNSSVGAGATFEVSLPLSCPSELSNCQAIANSS